MESTKSLFLPTKCGHLSKRIGRGVTTTDKYRSSGRLLRLRDVWESFANQERGRLVDCISSSWSSLLVSGQFPPPA